MYKKEKNILEKSKKILEIHDIDKDVLWEKYSILVNAYEGLLFDTQFITKVSDRLHKKLTLHYDDLKDKTDRLEKAQDLISEQNKKLKNSKKALHQIVTERTQKLAKTTNELQTAYKELLVVNKELDNFAYKAHHDLQGPVTRMVGLCRLANKDVQDEKARRYFKHMSINVELMQEILRRLLSINRLKETSVVKKTFWLEKVIEKAKNGLEQIYPDAFLLKINFKNTHFKLNTDFAFFEVLIGSMLEYTIKNSLKCDLNKPNGKACHIDFNCIKEGQNLQILVNFVGEEIPQTLREKIFDLFHRTGTHPKHTGMELYTANLAATKLNGIVQLISSSERETIFSIFLPGVIVD